MGQTLGSGPDSAGRCPCARAQLDIPTNASDQSDAIVATQDYCYLDPERFDNCDCRSCMVHCLEISPFAVCVPTLSTPEDVGRIVVSAARGRKHFEASARIRVVPCAVTPVGEHVLHLAVVEGTPELVNEVQIVMDLRAFRSHGNTFYSAVFPACVPFQLLNRILTNFLGCSPAAIFRGSQQLSGPLCSLQHGDILRPSNSIGDAWSCCKRR